MFLTNARPASFINNAWNLPFYVLRIAAPTSPSSSLISFLHAFLIDSIDWFEYVRTRGEGGGSKLVEIVCYGCVMMKATNDLYKLETMTVQTEIVRTGKFD